MESDEDSASPPAPDSAPCCSCGSRRCRPPAAGPRSVRPRLEKAGEDAGGGGAGGADGLYADWAARVDVEVEAAALREALAGHQQTAAELFAELEEERAASASAASEAMAMILRLQREKAAVQMELRQFKRFAEEKMAHDQQELLALEDLVYKREQALQALSCEVRAYRHRLLSYGIDPDSLSPIYDGDGEETPVFDYLAYEYPPFRCYDSVDGGGSGGGENNADLDKYPPGNGETPRRCARLRNLQRRIHQLERTPSQSSLGNEMEKGVVMGQSPRGWARHALHYSADTLGSPLAKVPNFSGKQQEEFPVVDGLEEFGGDDDDDTCDRVYTIDAVHCGPPMVGVCEDHRGSPRVSVCGPGCVAEETDIKKLYARLQALEADRESMRQAIISMRTDKAQLVLLKEIAQHLCREASPPPPPPPVRKLSKKPSLLGRFSFKSMIKWVASFVFWRKPTRRSKYTFGLSDRNVGLLLLLEENPQMRQWRCLPRIRY